MPYTSHVSVPETNQSLLAEAFQAGTSWTGKKLPVTFTLPSGHHLIVQGPRNEYNTAFRDGWLTAKSFKKG